MSDEKQIEEMACAMCGNNKICVGEGVEKCILYPTMWRYANNAYREGYRNQSEGGWIRAENPPEEYRDEYGELIPFLVCCKGTVYPFRAMYDGTNWGDGIGVLKVTHWMPLPDPPKANR